MSSSSSIPVMFTLPPSNRHELILVSPDEVKGMKQLNKLLTSTIQSSPNCAEFMNKYKSKDAQESIQEIRVHWAEAGRDRKVWPEYTLVTEENWGAVLALLGQGVGKDVLEVKVEAQKEE